MHSRVVAFTAFHLCSQTAGFVLPACAAIPPANSPISNFGSIKFLSSSSQTNKMSSPNTETESFPSTTLKYLGNKNLMEKQPAVPNDELLSDNFQYKLKLLKNAMKEHGGIGIAAPQIGWWTRVFCFGIEQGNARYPQAGSVPFSFWINPEIVWESKETNFMWEGCLSVPGMRGWVERPREVILKGLDENGSPCEKRLDGLAARIAQHELDHLDGVLFPMKVEGAGFLVPQASMDSREEWGEEWPSRGSRMTELGELCDER